jgi:hypothetical protein
LGQVPRQFPSSLSPIVIIVHGGIIFKLPLQCAVDRCDLFKANPALLGAPYTVRSNVPHTIFPDFLALLEDKPIETTSDHVGRLLLLCDEFRATALMVKLTEFRESPAFRGVARKEDRDAQVRIAAFEEVLTASLERASRLEVVVSGLVLALPDGFDSLIVLNSRWILREFLGKHFSLLWRGSCNGFSAKTYHSCCNHHAPTRTLILRRDGNVFGGSTPVRWDSRSNWKSDNGLKSFLLFAQECFNDDCNASTNSCTSLAHSLANDTGLDGTTIFTGSFSFQVNEIEVFEITK